MAREHLIAERSTSPTLGDPTDKRTLRIRLLGAFSVQVDSRPVPELRRRPRLASLVKVLALAAGHRMHREEVMELLWPDLNSRAAANNLHGTLHALRRALEPGLTRARRSAYLPLEGDLLSMRAPGGVWIDVEAFGVASEIARASGDAAAFESALELYTGDLLPDDLYADWATSARESVRERFLVLVLDLAVHYESLGEHWAAVRCLDRLVAVDALHEEAHVRLMQLYARLGQRHRAIRQYRQLENALSRELGVEPDHSATRVFNDIVAGRAAEIGDEIAARVPAASMERLSKREQQILSVIASRLSNRELAAAIGVTSRTAENDVTRILHKLGLRSRGELADWAQHRATYSR